MSFKIFGIEKQNKLIGIKITESEYKKLEELAKKNLPKNLKNTKKNIVNQFAKFIIYKYLNPYIAGETIRNMKHEELLEFKKALNSVLTSEKINKGRGK